MRESYAIFTKELPNTIPIHYQSDELVLLNLPDPRLKAFQKAKPSSSKIHLRPEIKSRKYTVANVSSIEPDKKEKKTVRLKQSNSKEKL